MKPERKARGEKVAKDRERESVFLSQEEGRDYVTGRCGWCGRMCVCDRFIEGGV